MTRRSAARLLFVVLLGGSWACGKPPEPEPITLPPQRFPKAGKPAKQSEKKPGAVDGAK